MQPTVSFAMPLALKPGKEGKLIEELSKKRMDWSNLEPLFYDLRYL